MVRFQSTLTNAGNGALQLCGYPSSSAAWLRAYQTTPGDLAACPGNAPSSGASGWFRYAVANHSATGEFNRWHLMDLQRFALVPVNAPGARTQWDTRWGTCMNDNQFMDCEHNAGATNLRAGIAPHTDKVTEEGAPDQTVVAFPNRIPNGSYQLVAISNPYGAIREVGTTYGSVSCVSLQVSGDAEVGEWRVYQAGATPTNCLLPTNIPGALTGPGGTDPFAGANPAAACNPLLITGHCWDTIPVDGAHPIAHTNVRDTSTATATRTVAQYGAVGTYGPGGGGGNPGGGWRWRRCPDHAAARGSAGAAAPACGPAQGRAHAPDARGPQGPLLHPHRPPQDVRHAAELGEGHVPVDRRRQPGVHDELEARRRQELQRHRPRVVHVDHDPGLLELRPLRAAQAARAPDDHDDARRARRRDGRLGVGEAPPAAPARECSRRGMRSTATRVAQPVLHAGEGDANGGAPRRRAAVSSAPGRGADGLRRTDVRVHIASCGWWGGASPPGQELSTPRTRMFHLLSLLRHKRTRVALTAAVASLSLAALPVGRARCPVQGQPQNVVGGFFDDHSIGGDNHLGWGYTGTGGTSQAEPLAITFGTTLTNTGPDQFRVCGYNAAGGWMAAYQVAAATCPATAAGAGAQDGWFRYVTANHSEPTATPAGSAFNRWHLMDLQRFALVPLPTSLGGPAGAYTAWDTTWGTCLSDGGLTMDCDQDATPAAPLADRNPGGRREDDAGAQPRP